MLQAVVTMVRQIEVLIVAVHQVAVRRMIATALHLLHVAAIPAEAAAHAHRTVAEAEVPARLEAEVEAVVAVAEDNARFG